jgi:uncharacterized protein YlxW (UPF0749 family)
LFTVYAATKTTQFLNYREYLKTEIDSLQNQVKVLNKSIENLEYKRDSIRIIRQKISIQSELEALKKLAKEYEALKSEKLVVNDSISLEDLHIFYLKQINK